MSTLKRLLLLIAFVTCCSCSKPAVAPQGGSSSREERKALKRQYVEDLRRERSPIRGWVASESAGDERGWGTLTNPLSTSQATDNVMASDSVAVENMILASDIHTNDILFAPPPEDLRKLLATACRIVDWLVTADGSRLFPNSDPPAAVLEELATAAARVPSDMKIVQLRATADGRTYPKLSIELERGDDDSSERRLAALARERYDCEIADVQNGILTALVELPIVTKTRKNRDLRFGFLYDRETENWIATTLEIRPDKSEISNALKRETSSDQRTATLQRLGADNYTIAFTDISQNIPLLAE